MRSRWSWGSADYEFLRSWGEHLASVAGDQDDVFDPYAAITGNVDARLDSDHHPGLQLLLLSLCQPRRLMNFNALKFMSLRGWQRDKSKSWRPGWWSLSSLASTFPVMAA